MKVLELLDAIETLDLIAGDEHLLDASRPFKPSDMRNAFARATNTFVLDSALPRLNGGTKCVAMFIHHFLANVKHHLSG
jgi:hypothetical protein